MELGSGIFLSSVFLGTVALFIATKDRWNWRKLVVRTGLVTLTLGSILVGGLAAYSWLERRPTADVVLWNIKVGHPQGDVKFLKGAPRFVVEASGTEPERWIYPLAGDKGSYVVGFRDGSVAFAYYEGERGAAPYLQGIGGYGDIAAINDELGLAEKIVTSTDGLRRILLYPKWRTWFGVTGDGIKAMGIYDPARWEPGSDATNWAANDSNSQSRGPWESYKH